MALKFKIEKGITAPRRGPKAKWTQYEELYPLLPQMKPGDSIKIVEVPESRRNSAYLSINGVLQKQFEKLKGNYYVGSAKITGGKVELRVFRQGEEESPKKSTKKK